MARRPTGAVVEHVGRDGTIYRALRFTAYGKRRHVTLGAVSAADADRELRYTLDDVERGTWQPPQAAVVAEPELVPTFREFADQWWLRSKGQLRASTQADYKWRLEANLIPFFGDLAVDAITYDTVERYIAAKLAEKPRPLSARSINMTVTLLGAILEGAVERDLLLRNPARGKRRRVREQTPARSYLDTAGQVSALLAAAGRLDAAARSNTKHVHRRAIVATLMFAGLRIGELTALRWRDVNLATGWLRVGESKTDAGRRQVKIRDGLRDELLEVRMAATDVAADAFVFATSTGRRSSKDNIRSRVLARAVEEANKQLAKDGLTALPQRITPHSLRRTFASIMYAIGEDPGVVMDEIGHTDPALALRVYRQSMRRGDDEKAALRALLSGEQLADIGRRDENDGPAATDEKGDSLPETADLQAVHGTRPAGFEPATSRSGGTLGNSDAGSESAAVTGQTDDGGEDADLPDQAGFGSIPGDSGRRHRPSAESNEPER